MVATRPYIIYSLPKSRTTQALTGGKIEKAWANVERFLTTCTNADLNNPINIYLRGYISNKHNITTDKNRMETDTTRFR